MQTAPKPLKVVAGRGALLELEDGRQILDCISSWWVTLHGHAEAEIAAAIAHQSARLEQVIFAGFTHEPAQVIANRVVRRLPEGLKYAFFSDNGSTAVEVALKMALQYFHNRGETRRNRFVGFTNGYHGDTVGAMSIGGTAPFWQAYRPVMFNIDTVPFPDTFDGDQAVDEKETRSLHELRTLLEDGKDGAHHAGICIEPLVQGAAGMRMCRPQFLRQLETMARAYDVLLIYDEVMTGFGRTGDWFAATKSDTKPDLIALSKGITGGFLPLALTVANEKVYQSFLSDDLQKAFFHSHSYTANPIACAAAVASIDILERQCHRFQNMEAAHRRLADEFWRDMPERLEKLRFTGTIAAADIVCQPGGYFNQLSTALRATFLEMGLLLRPLGNSVYILPPYCITDGELESAYKGIAQAVANL
jgi:adenosylmethionine-8-amino-7-oxononanoate aminotransferase